MLTGKIEGEYKENVQTHTLLSYIIIKAYI